MIRRSDVTVADSLNTPQPGVYITVLDVNGTEATIYSDNGVNEKANPFTSGLDGTFEYWAAEGAYTEEYRRSLGGQPRQVVAVELSGNAHRNAYSTRAGLALEDIFAANGDVADVTEPGAEGDAGFSSADHTADVTADPGQGLYIAPASDTTGASGAWFFSRLERIKPTRFNGDGATAHEVLIQRAWDAAASEAAKGNHLVVDIDRPFQTNAMLYLPSGIVVEGSDPDASISAVTSVGTNFEKQAVAFGTFGIPSNYSLNDSPAGGTGSGALEGGLYLQRVAFYTTLAPFYGGTDFQISAGTYAALAGNIGAPLFIRDEAYYYSAPGEGQVPHRSGPAILKSLFTSGGLYYMRVRDPIPTVLAVPYFAVIDSPIDLITEVTKLDFLGLRTDYILADTKFLGVSLDSTTNAMSSHGMMIGCETDIPLVTGKTGQYVNGAGHCDITVRKIIASNQLIDTAGGGWASKFKYGTLHYRFLSGTSSSSEIPISVNEGTTHQYIEIGDVILDGWAYGSANAIRFGACEDCTVEIKGGIEAPVGAGSFISLVNTQRTHTVDVGETQSPTKRNTVRAKHLKSGGSMQRYYLEDNSGGQLDRTTFEVGYAEGTVSGGAVTLAGTNSKIRGCFATGSIDMTSAGAGADIDVTLETGLLHYANQATAAKLVVNGINMKDEWGGLTDAGGVGVMSWTPALGTGFFNQMRRASGGGGTFTLNNWTGTVTSGGGVGAIVAANLSAGAVASVTVVNGGSGYTSPTATIFGGGGSGATATVTVVAGVITALVITNGGSGYTYAPTVLITGGELLSRTFKFRIVNAYVSTDITAISFGTKYETNGITLPTLPSGKYIDLTFSFAQDGSAAVLQSAVLQK